MSRPDYAAALAQHDALGAIRAIPQLAAGPTETTLDAVVRALRERDDEIARMTRALSLEAQEEDAAPDFVDDEDGEDFARGT